MPLRVRCPQRLSLKPCDLTITKLAKIQDNDTILNNKYIIDHALATPSLPGGFVSRYMYVKVRIELSMCICHTGLTSMIHRCAEFKTPSNTKQCLPPELGSKLGRIFHKT